MSGGAIKKLSIEHLRGSVMPFTLSFEKGKKLTVIYGENGTGKSTICDAFDFIGNGKIGSLENRGLGKTNGYWQSIGKLAADVIVTLEVSDATCQARINRNNVVVEPQEKQPRVEVLRRSQILSLIEATPGERYNVIRRFIDVSEIEASEHSLKELITLIEKNREVAVARVQENRESIQQFWETADKPGHDSLTWAKGEVGRDTTTLELEANALNSIRAAFDRLAEFPEMFRIAQTNMSNSETELKDAQEKLEQLTRNISQESQSIIAILESAKKHFENSNASGVCPLCESTEKADHLPEKVSQRLNAVESLSIMKTSQEDKTHKEKNLVIIQDRLKTLIQNAKTQTINFERIKSENNWIPNNYLPSEAVPDNLADWSNWLTANSNLPSDWIKAENKRRDNKNFFDTLKRNIKILEDNTEAQTELDILLPRLQRCLEIVGIERRQFTDSILAKIATEVGRLYELVHPSEGLEKISLELDPKKRASLEMGATFGGIKNAPPQAYFSDSHLDTLGLCVFLALAMLDSPEHKILVLDDVLASVDEPHVERLIEMLYQETSKFKHCIMTTHYRPWKEKLRWGWLQNGQCQFVELSKWTNTNGLTLISSLPDVTKLRSLLVENPIDPQLVCSKAGFILEATLEFLTQLYECSVPRKAGGRFTIGDLLPAIDKKLRSAIKVEQAYDTDPNGILIYKTIELGPLLEELTRIAQARNVFGCHFNELSFQLLETDASHFGQIVLNLMEVLTDEKNGWPKNGKSGSYWATHGETRRLHPLKRPG